MNTSCNFSAALAGILPRLRALQGRTVLVKYGGNAMTDTALQAAFAHDVVLLRLMGLRVVVVHGGGPHIEAALGRLGMQGRFVQGMRVTDEATMQVVSWVLAGQVQQELVALIDQAGGRALGLTGRDGALLRAKPLRVQDAADPALWHDLGLVGDVESVDTRVVDMALAGGYIPVVSPLGLGAGGESYNINADVAAAHLAVALQADRLLMLSNIAGVLDAQGQIIAQLDAARIDALCAQGTISGGMIPKMEGALAAARCGVGSVHIIDGRVPHAMLDALLADAPVGTEIRSA